MATSGSSNFTQDRNECIEDAFSLIGMNSVGKSLSSEDIALANRFLNKMIKGWATKGLHLWSKTEGVLYFTQYQGKYIVSDASTSAYCTLKTDEIITKLSADVATSATTLTVTNTTGMTVGDYIGVVLSNQTLFWTTIATIPSSTSLTLTTGLTSASTSSSLVFTFTNRLTKPLKIRHARLVSGYDSGSSTTKTEIPLNIISYENYFDLVMSSTNGQPNQIAYNPNRITGDLYTWPRPIDCSQRIEFTYDRILEDLDSADDDFDLPSEWLETVTYQLAMRLGPMYGKDQRVQSSIAPIASTLLDNLLSWDNEITSITFEMDTGGGDD